MITMISVSSFQLTHSFTHTLFLTPCLHSLSLSLFILFGWEILISVALYYSSTIFQSFSHSLTHSFTLSLTPPPNCFLLVFIYLSFHSLHFHLNFQCLRHIDLWMRDSFHKWKILKVFPYTKKKQKKKKERKKIIIICLGKFISIHTTHILTMYFDVPILGVFKIIQIICQYIFMGNKLCILPKIN